MRAPPLLEEDTGRAWELYEIGAVRCPAYEVPYGPDEVAATVLDRFDAERDVCVACILLPFHGRPAWPQRRPLPGPDAFRFYYCAGSDCGRAVAHDLRPDYRMALQFVVGVSTTTNRAAVGWVTRLMCASCAPLRGDTSAYPVILDARGAIQETLRGALRGFNDAVSRRACYICEAKLLQGRAPRGAIPMCASAECRAALEQMGTSAVWRTIFEPSAYQRMVNLVQHFRGRGVNLSRIMRWPICHNAQSTCIARGNAALECARCARVAYCGKRCARESAPIHGKHCEPFAAVWNIDRLMLWSDGFVARLSQPSGDWGGGAAAMSGPMVLHCKCVAADGSFEEAARAFSEPRGRYYYACALGRRDRGGCGFFRWGDDVEDEYDEEDSFCVAEDSGGGE